MYFWLGRKNSTLFLFFPVTVAENSWKNQMSGNFVFSSWKMGVESRGTRRDPEGVEMGCTPAWDPHFSTWKLKILANLVFSIVFRNVTGKKRNRLLFLIFSTFWPIIKWIRCVKHVNSVENTLQQCGKRFPHCSTVWKTNSTVRFPVTAVHKKC